MPEPCAACCGEEDSTSVSVTTAGILDFRDVVLDVPLDVLDGGRGLLRDGLG